MTDRGKVGNRTALPEDLPPCRLRQRSRDFRRSKPAHQLSAAMCRGSGMNRLIAWIYGFRFGVQGLATGILI